MPDARGTSEQHDLVERVRAVLASESKLREVKMFGARAFMVNEKMAVAAKSGGELLVHIDPDRFDELTARPGAAQSYMGKGRSMGPGWIEVAHDALEGDADLAFWVDVALEHNRLNDSISSRT